MKILLIEDSENAGQMLERILKLFGHDVRRELDGQAGVLAAGVFGPDVVLCDIGLPGMSGLDVARILRAQPALANLRLIAMSGYGQEEDIRRSLEAGFNRHLVKPLDPMTLTEILSEQPATVAASDSPPPAPDPPALNMLDDARRVLLVENDTDQARAAAHALADARFKVTHARSTGQALKLAQSEEFDLAILDIQMPPGSEFTQAETAGGTRTGLALARRLRMLKPQLPLAAVTYSEDPEVVRWFSSQEQTLYLSKGHIRPTQLARILKRRLLNERVPLKIFIVHGHDHATMTQVKTYLRDNLGLGEPTVLAEMPSHGRTIIEKFEYYAADVDLVFVLMTPDDVGYLSGNTSAASQRARQNVIFECGYFLGSLRRQTGRVVLLHNGWCEIPSDMGGLACIDIAGGLEAADRQIRHELADWIGSPQCR